MSASLHRILSMILSSVIMLVFAGIVPANASTKEEKQAQFALKVKDGVASLGTGPEARVKLKLRDKTKLAGYISEAGENSFTVTNPKNGETTTVAYTNVTQMHGHHRHWGRSKWAVIAVLAAVIVGLAVALSENH